MSTKRLRSVCHSLAHHATSALSFLHPHLRVAARLSGQSFARVDLLSPSPYPIGFRESKPLRLALGALRLKFEQLLRSEHMAVSDLAMAALVFEPVPDADDSCTVCNAFLAAKAGPTVSYAVSYVGKRVAPNLALQPAAPRQP